MYSILPTSLLRVHFPLTMVFKYDIQALSQYVNGWKSGKTGKCLLLNTQGRWKKRTQGGKAEVKEKGNYRD